MEKYSIHRRNNIPRLIPNLSEKGIDLLSRMLKWNPKKRITLKEAMQHPYFYESPKAFFPDEIKILNRLEFYCKKSNEEFKKKK